MRVKLAVLLLLSLSTFACVSKEEIDVGKKHLPETARELTALANDEKLGTLQRGAAIYRLFEEHVRKDMTLAELADVFRTPMWFKESDTSEVTVIFGAIPFKRTFGDTIICILVFPNEDPVRHNKECIGIYMNIEGRIDVEAFLDVVKNGKKSKYETSKLKDWGLSPTLEEHTQRSPR